MTTSIMFANRLAVSVPEAAFMLGVAPKTIYNQLSAGRCPLQTIKFGRRRMVLLEGIRALAVRPFPEAPQRLSPHAENSN